MHRPRGGRALVFAVLGSALAGCIGSPDDPADARLTQADVPAPDVRPELVVPSFRQPVLLGSAAGAEPNVAIGPDGGTVYVTTPLHLWRSRDGGASFEAVGEPYCEVPFYDAVRPAPLCPAGWEARDPGLDGGGDGDIAADAAGTLYWVGLGGVTAAIPFQVSRDQAGNWTSPIDLGSRDDGAPFSHDRPWIAARPNGTLYASWQGGGLVLRASFDGGATWDDARAVVDGSAQAGPVAVDPSSPAIYVPFATACGGPSGSDCIGGADRAISVARSADHGRTWEVSPVATFHDASINGAPLAYLVVAAVDDVGTVYVVWAVDPAPPGSPVTTVEVFRHAVFLSASTDGGRTWGEALRLSPEGVSAVFPWVAAGKPGRVAVAWYQNRLGAPTEGAPDLWDVVLVESVDADRASPTFVGGAANTEPIHLGTICTKGLNCLATGGDRSLLEFFELAIGPDGQPVLAWAADSQYKGQRVLVFAGGVAEGTALR